MKKIAHRAAWLLWLLAAASLPACRTVPQSDYLQRYENNFVDAALPSSSEITNNGQKQEFKAPAEVVWRQCLRVAAQKQGVLAVDSGSGGNSSRRLLVLDGHHLVIMQQASQGGLDVSTFLDTWLAVTVVPQDAQSCWVHVAWVNPQTNKVSPFPPSPAPEAWSISVAQMGPVFKSFGIRKQRQFVPQVRAVGFLLDVAAQLDGPGLWLAKVKSPSPAPRGAPPAIEARDDPGYPELKNDYGNWCSLLLRRNTCVVNAPEFTGELTRILNDLKKAAGKGNMPTRIYVISTPEKNAFSLPNGDIFLCSGLLDLLSDANEVAAVLAHEFDHYAQHDAVYKIKNEYATEVLVISVEVAAAMAGGVISGIMSTPTTLGGVVSPNTQIAAELLKDTTSQAAAAAGSGVQDTIVTGYSQEIELRADKNGMRYLWAAGYDPHGMIQVMEKLKSAEGATRDSKANTGSHLVNSKMDPELMGKLQSTLNDLSK